MTETIEHAVDERTYAAWSRPLWWRVVMTREFAMIALLGIVYAWATGNVDNFDNPLTLYYLFLDVAPILMIALPMTLVIITGGIDLSVASVMGLSSVLLGIFHVDLGMSLPVAALFAIAAGVLCGCFNGFLVGYVGLPPLAVTIGSLALFRGIAVGLLGTEAITDFPDRWSDLARERIVEGSSYPVVLAPIVVLIVAFALLLHYSPFGRGIYEIGLNEQAARFSGVDVQRTKLILYALSGAVAAFAGIYYTLRYGSARGDNAEYLELQIVAAVLLGGVSIFGGRGALHGVIAGVLLIGVLQSALRLESVSSNVINIVIGVLLVLSVISTSFLSWVSGLRATRRRSPAGAARPDGSPGDRGPTNPAG
ncbi:ABC transporter permease [Nocardioides panacisoli]|uniref:ABC transporter permease n=1 Tax=Nocardioides panacisoli TaxID=627624 RepID=UPI001C63A7BF|nr:ABC transporter permease [Nocardioides panacisoli]QYJ03024.1 ABC transporter permease [Nocardioides panacisoli]